MSSYNTHIFDVKLPHLFALLSYGHRVTEFSLCLCAYNIYDPVYHEPTPQDNLNLSQICGSKIKLKNKL